MLIPSPLPSIHRAPPPKIIFIDNMDTNHQLSPYQELEQVFAQLETGISELATDVYIADRLAKSGLIRAMAAQIGEPLTERQAQRLVDAD